MYSWELGLLTLIFALAASDHLILLCSQEVPPNQMEPPPTPSSSSKYAVIGAVAFILVIAGPCAICFICRERRIRSYGFYRSPKQQSPTGPKQIPNGQNLLPVNKPPLGSQAKQLASTVPSDTQVQLESIQNEPSKSRDKPSPRTMSPQTPQEPTETANDGNQLSSKKQRSTSRDKPSACSMPPQAPQESIRNTNDGNPLSCEKQLSRSDDKPSTRTMPPQAPQESIQNEPSKSQDKPSPRTMSPQTPQESIQNANDGNQLPGKNEHSRGRDKPLACTVPPKAPLESIQNANDGNQCPGKIEHSRGQDKLSAGTVPPQAPLESIQNANDKNQLPGKNEHSRGRDKSSTHTVPPQAPVESIQNFNDRNQLSGKNEHSRGQDKPSASTMPPQAPPESIQNANDGNQLPSKNEHSRGRDKSSARTMPSQPPLESIQNSNAGNQLPGKNEHSGGRDKPSARIVPSQALVESIQNSNAGNQLHGKNEHSRGQDKPLAHTVPPQALLESIQNANDGNHLLGKIEHSRGRDKPSTCTVPPQAPLESIQNANDGNELPSKIEHSRGRDKPSAHTVPPQAPLGENECLRGQDTLSTRTVAPQAPQALPSSSKVLELKHIPRMFTYDELHSATKGFDDSNCLGKGGFGTVYKGVISSNNKIVAIKKLEACARQGIQQFLTEVNVISQAHHKHIVSLVGYYCGQDEGAVPAMMLVYEFIPNNSLDYQLHGRGTKTIDWETRMKIAIGSAKGLTYLHEGCEPKIIHCDIKSANILLTDNFQTKIADFGLAKLLPDTATHVSVQQCMGTFGYLAPECLDGGKISEKSDVFAFGVVLLELITGQKACGSFSEGMVKWARPKLFAALKSEDPNFEALADRNLQNNYSSEGMFRMVSCAANCVRHSANLRPTMREVLDALEGKIRLDNEAEVSPQLDGYMIKVWERLQNGVYDWSSSLNA